MQEKLIEHTPKVHVVIPVFNGWEQTKVCLNALRASEYKNLEIIVVDHGSIDETKTVLPTQYPEVVHVLGDSSLWWAGATNLGIQTAISKDADKIMLLNNDCYVTPEVIGRLVHHSKKKALAIIAPVQKDFDTGEHVCTTYRECFLLGFPSLPYSRIVTNKTDNDALVPSSLISGGRGVIIPVDVFKCVGMFDERALPHYYADHDFYLRCRKQGVSLYVALDSVIYIDKSRTSVASRYREMTLSEFYQTLFNRRSHRNLRDLNTLFKKHYPIRGFHYIGVALNIIRYFFVYIWHRIMCTATH